MTGAADVSGDPQPAARKRTKADDLDAAAVEAKVRQMHSQGQLTKLTIPEMKCFLKAKKLSVGGKKAELMARVSECLAGPTAA